MKVIFTLACLSTVAFAAFDTTHKAWDKILKAQVTVKGPVSAVNYKALKASPGELDSYLKEVSALPKAEFDKWGDKDRLAFLINAYNAYTVKLVLDHYPVKSIKDIGSATETPWKKKFFKLFGEDTSLDNIEHDMIRARFAEPRIHFAVVCASKGCPSLRNEAFVGKKIDAQLEAALRSFLSDTARNRWDSAASKLSLSKIFDWYGDDFKKKDGSVPAFVAPRMGKGAEEQAKIKSASVDWLDYDWSLNETGGDLSASK